MVEFKTVISDPKSGKTYQWEVTGHHANSLVGKRMGDEVDGIFVRLPGYKLVITGGSDKDGFPMRRELPGPKRRKVLITEGVGFHPDDKGVRRRKTVRGGTISPDIVQINMRITVHGSKSIEDLLKEEESK
ncbi:MAG: 30S ribosomal protein S6e [Thermoplasmata archaeon]|nr:MAG: 30S ribosomal protein S6e [Thermoplasmata archaeon]